MTDKYLDEVNEICQKISKKYFFDVENAKSNGDNSGNIKQYSVVLEPDRYAVTCYLNISGKETASKRYWDAVEQIAFVMNTTSEEEFLNDQDVQTLLDSKLRNDPNTTFIYDNIENIQSAVSWYHNLAYQMMNDFQKAQNPISLKDKSTDKLDMLLADMFKEWCRYTYTHNLASDIPMLEYPERASLNAGTIEHFISMKSQDGIRLWNSDALSIQDSIIKGLGVNENHTLDDDKHGKDKDIVAIATVNADGTKKAHRLDDKNDLDF